MREICPLGLTVAGLKPAYGLASEALPEETGSNG